MTEIPQAGDLAPTFEAVDQDGTAVALADFAGRWLLLYFYPRDDTPGCTIEAQEFTALAAEFAALECDIVGVSPDSPQKHCNFIAKYGLGVRLLELEQRWNEGLGDESSPEPTEAALTVGQIGVPCCFAHR